MLNLIPLFRQTHNYRKPHPNTDGGNVEKHRPDTWTYRPNAYWSLWSTSKSARPITACDSVLVLNSAGLWKYASRLHLSIEESGALSSSRNTAYTASQKQETLENCNFWLLQSLRFYLNIIFSKNRHFEDRFWLDSFFGMHDADDASWTAPGMQNFVAILPCLFSNCISIVKNLM